MSLIKQQALDSNEGIAATKSKVALREYQRDLVPKSGENLVRVLVRRYPRRRLLIFAHRRTGPRASRRCAALLHGGQGVSEA